MHEHFKILESPVKQMQRDAISADNFNESKSICDIVGVCEVSVYLLDFISLPSDPLVVWKSNLLPIFIYKKFANYSN